MLTSFTSPTVQDCSHFSISRSFEQHAGRLALRIVIEMQLVSATGQMDYVFPVRCVLAVS